MPTTKQRREAARRHLERQLQRREEREAARKRFTLIASIVGTIVLITLVTVFIVVISKEDKKSKDTAATPTPTATPTTPVRAAKGPAVSFSGVTVKGATDLGGKPGVTSKAAGAATKLTYEDLVVGKGAAASPASSVNVQYVGVLYKDGTEFDSSWSKGGPTTFSMSEVVPGFTEGISGTTGVPPMKVGGRRIMIVPAALAYGSTPKAGIPLNSSLVFVVDLIKVG